MSKFEELQKMKECPLCFRHWHIIEEPGKTGRAYFACNHCMISTWIRDIMIGHYDEYEKVPCPICGEKDMRFFCRAEPGYFKDDKQRAYVQWKCPKCGAKVESHDPDVHKRAIELKELRDKYGK